MSLFITLGIFFSWLDEYKLIFLAYAVSPCNHFYISGSRRATHEDRNAAGGPRSGSTPVAGTLGAAGVGHRLLVPTAVPSEMAAVSATMDDATAAAAAAVRHTLIRVGAVPFPRLSAGAGAAVPSMPASPLTSEYL